MSGRWLPVHKPAGFTSHDVVAVARKRLGFKKIGHTGTLDPDATGVLVLALGKATRLIQYLPGDKVYRARIRLGLTTNSYDTSGQVLTQQPVPELSLRDLQAALAPFLGDILQVPPMVSAVSYQGKRLYEWARQGHDLPERAARKVTIHRLTLLDWQTPDLSLEVACSAGTYIRSLAHDLGQNLGCGAALAELVRSQANGFGLEACLSLDALRPLSEQPEPGLANDFPLAHLPQLKLSWELAQRLLQGQRLERQMPDPSVTGMVRLYAPDQTFLGLAQLDDTLVRPRLLMLGPDGLVNPDLLHSAVPAHPEPVYPASDY